MINHPNRSKAEKVIDITVAKRVLEIVDAGLVNGVGKPNPGQMCVEAAVCYALGLPHGDDPQCVSRALRALKIRLNDSRWSSPQARGAGLRRLAVAQLGSRDHIDDNEFRKRVVELVIRTSVPTVLRYAASIHKSPEHMQALRDAANRCEVEGSRQSALDARKVAQEARAAAADSAAAYAAAYVYADAAAAAAAYAAADAAVAAYVYADAAAYAAADSAAAYAAAYAAADAAAAAYVYADAAAYAAADAAAAAYAAADARDKSLADFAEGVVQILIEMKAPGCQWLALTEAPR
jgi:hypothetical protein